MADVEPILEKKAKRKSMKEKPAKREVVEEEPMEEEEEEGEEQEMREAPARLKKSKEPREKEHDDVDEVVDILLDGRPAAAGDVLSDDIFTDPRISFRVSWVGYKKEDTTDEPFEKLKDSNMNEIMECVRRKVKEVREEEAAKKKTARDYERQWLKFKEKFQLTSVSSVDDFFPLAAQYPCVDEKAVRVRIQAFTQPFYDKLTRAEKYKTKYPVEWEGSKAFVTLPTADFKKKWPESRIYKAIPDRQLERVVKRAKGELED